MARQHWLTASPGTRWRWIGGTALAACCLATAAVLWLAWGPHRISFDEAEQLAARRDFPMARAALERYLAVHPNHFRARLLMAQVARRAGFLEEARVQLDIAEAIEFRTVDVVREHVLIETQLGDFSNEAELWRLVKTGDPGAPQILEALARGYRKNYLLDDMQAALNRLLTLEPDHIGARLDRAWIHEQRFDFDSALADCHSALQTDPRDAESQLRLAQLLLVMEKPGEAHEVLTPLRARRPDDPRVALALFQAYRKLAKTAEAAQLNDELAARYPKEISILIERGRFLTEQGDPVAAEPLLRAAAEQSPFDYQARYSLQLCLRQLGRTKEADEERVRAEQLANDLKQMSELTQKLQKARHDPDIRSEIGRIFLRSGEEREGLAWLKTVLRLHPQHAPTHQALAEHYERIRQPALAEHHKSFLDRKQGTTPP